MGKFGITSRGAMPLLLFGLVCLVSACEQGQPDIPEGTQTETLDWQSLVTEAPENQPYDAAKLAMVASQFERSNAPEKIAYQEQIATTLASDLPVLPLTDLSHQMAIRAQQILLDDERLKEALFYPQTNEPLRNEVMSVSPALPGDRVGAASSCQIGECYRIDIYNFFHNITITGIVDIITQRVLVINTLPETQPDLSPRLEQLAIAIAKNEPAVGLEIQRFLSRKGASKDSIDEPAEITPVMVSTKSALKNSLCERSKHLCVAPTYVLGDQALWVIVDLTDMKVAGLRWTMVGESGPPVVVTERTLENEYVFKNYCQEKNIVERNGWRFNYHLTASDGLRVADASFNQKHVFNSAKVVDWHVSYSREDNFGYSDATGCPMFSSAVVVAYDGPKIESILENEQEVGFAIVQDFRQLPWPAACNYRYEERYEFYNDGRYRVAMSNHGRGCGTDGTYRPVLRIELGRPDAQHSYALQQWREASWQTVEQEAWSRQPAEADLHQGQFSHRLMSDDGTGYLLSPSIGQFWDGGRGDDAFIYATVQHEDKDEGTSDLVTLGSCCNTDYQQGPELFMSPAESLVDQALVLWYVPQIHNDGQDGSKYCWADTEVVEGVQRIKTWPCTGGPMFMPINFN